MKKLLSLLTTFVVLFSALFFSGCTPVAEPVTKVGYFFNTFVSITFYSDEDARLFTECENLCNKYENMLSRTVEGSDIYKINHAGGAPVTVNEETAELITTALSFCENTEGAVDITVAPLMDAWNFTGEEENKIPPSNDVINDLLEHVNYLYMILVVQLV